MRQCPMASIRLDKEAVRNGAKSVYLFMGNISWNIDIHDPKVLANGPPNIFHYPVNLHSQLNIMVVYPCT